MIEIKEYLLNDKDLICFDKRCKFCDLLFYPEQKVINVIGDEKNNDEYGFYHEKCYQKNNEIYNAKIERIAQFNLIKQYESLSSFDFENIKNRLNLSKTAKDYFKSTEDFIKVCIDEYCNNHPIPIKFPFEKDFQEYIVSNLYKLRNSLKLKGEGYRLNNGEIIDILADDGNSHYTIIEVKLNANHDAIPQILSYMHQLAMDERYNISVNGIIIGTEVTPKLINIASYYNSNQKNVNNNIDVIKFDYQTKTFLKQSKG